MLILKRIWTSEERFNIIMESFQNPNITIAEICRNHGIAVSLFYKWRKQFLEGFGCFKILGDTS